MRKKSGVLHKLSFLLIILLLTIGKKRPTSFVKRVFDNSIHKNQQFKQMCRKKKNRVVNLFWVIQLEYSTSDSHYKLLLFHC